MSRFTPYLGAVAAFSVFAFVVSFFNSTAVQRVSSDVVPVASSTLAVMPGFTIPQLVSPDIVAETSSSTVSAPKVVPIKKVKPFVAPPASVSSSAPPVSVTTTITVPVPPVSASLRASASTLINALVNIICYVPKNSGLHSISGSGVIIDPKGIILTNAHIAQYFLLTDRNVYCTIRAGSPAIDKYEASLVYIPYSWIQANPTVLTEANPIGTGEYDFALLAVTSSATSATLPSSFPFIPLAITPPNTGTPVVIAAYPAQFLEMNQILFSLFPTIVFGSVKDVFTFASTSIDVLALGGSVVAQEGSSGGGASDINGQLVGTITTSTNKGATDTRSLDAITASYIRAEYASETGEAIDLLLAKPTLTAISDFAPQMPALESVLTANLP